MEASCLTRGIIRSVIAFTSLSFAVRRMKFLEVFSSIPVRWGEMDVSWSVSPVLYRRLVYIYRPRNVVNRGLMGKIVGNHGR